jgi:2-polyprenyl-3-methyl-5-hydroxy-6-metoxy-1,4-benzoquinol methylase
MVTCKTDVLSQFRLRAAIASGGTSDDLIKTLVIRLLDQYRVAGALLDFGAGRGELLARLHSLGRFRKLTGIDILQRPRSLPTSIDWYTQDLNEDPVIVASYDCILCSEVIEHLENPRATLRRLNALLAPGGVLVLTMPNQESLRSYLTLFFAGHFAHFQNSCYPAHITALLRLDLERICVEAGFANPDFYYSDHGAIPKLTCTTWQRASCGLLKGRLFSDNVAMVATKKGQA